MKSITIHNIETELYEAIKMNAKKNSRSLNREIKDKLSKYYLKNKEIREKSDFKKFLNLWDESDKVEFEENTKELRKIDDRDWR